MATYPIKFVDQLRQHLRSLRKKRGLTQAQLGALLGVSQSRIAEIEANPGAVTLDKLLQLFSVLQVNIALSDTAPTETDEARERLQPSYLPQQQSTQSLPHARSETHHDLLHDQRAPYNGLLQSSASEKNSLITQTAEIDSPTLAEQVPANPILAYDKLSEEKKSAQKNALSELAKNASSIEKIAGQTRASDILQAIENLKTQTVKRKNAQENALSELAQQASSMKAKLDQTRASEILKAIENFKKQRTIQEKAQENALSKLAQQAANIEAIARQTQNSEVLQAIENLKQQTTRNEKLASLIDFPYKKGSW